MSTSGEWAAMISIEEEPKIRIRPRDRRHGTYVQSNIDPDHPDSGKTLSMLCYSLVQA